MLARPRDIGVDSAGRVYVLDQQDRRVVVIAPDGERLATIGRPGEGPGEFVRPQFLDVAGTRVRVFDFGQSRISIFSTGGQFLRAYRTDIPGLATSMSFGPDGRIAYSGTSVPRQGGLFALADVTSRETSIHGELVSQEAGIPPDLLRRMHDRRLPESFRNQALPVFTSDGLVWVLLQTEGILKLFSPSGVMLSQRKLAVPEKDLIVDEFFDWYATVQASDMLRFLTLVESGLAVGESLWLLWNTPRGQPWLITVHDDSGAVTERLIMPEGSGAAWQTRAPRRRFAVDCDRRRVYVLEGAALSAVWFDLPAEVGGCSTA